MNDVQLDRGEEITINKRIYSVFSFEFTVLAASSDSFPWRSSLNHSCYALFDDFHGLIGTVPCFAGNLPNRVSWMHLSLLLTILLGQNFTFGSFLIYFPLNDCRMGRGSAGLTAVIFLLYLCVLQELSIAEVGSCQRMRIFVISVERRPSDEHNFNIKITKYNPLHWIVSMFIIVIEFDWWIGRSNKNKPRIAITSTSKIPKVWTRTNKLCSWISKEVNLTIQCLENYYLNLEMLPKDRWSGKWTRILLAIFLSLRIEV